MKFPKTFRSSQSGFTFLEFVIVATLIGIVLLLGQRFLTSTKTGSDVVLDRLNALSKAKTGLWIITKDVTEARGLTATDVGASGESLRLSLYSSPSIFATDQAITVLYNYYESSGTITRIINDPARPRPQEAVIVWDIEPPLASEQVFAFDSVTGGVDINFTIRGQSGGLRREQRQFSCRIQPRNTFVLTAP